MTYLEQIQQLVGASVTVRRGTVESYQCMHKSEGQWHVVTSSNVVAQFTLVAMPGCCGIVVSTGSRVCPVYVRRGLGTLLNQMRTQMAWELGYTVMLCTDVATNAPQQKILLNNSWTSELIFNNRRTGNDVLLHSISLRDTGIELGFKL